VEQRGAVYLHKKMAFSDGGISEKYLILLNPRSQNDPYLFVKTTSQQKNKPLTPGCIEKEQLFFIPSGKTFFHKPTWVQLYPIYEITAETVSKDPNISLVNALDSKMMEQLIDCLFRATERDIEPKHRNLLRPGPENGLRKLMEKWGKKK
jgi:hypothetical protein